MKSFYYLILIGLIVITGPANAQSDQSYAGYCFSVQGIIQNLERDSSLKPQIEKACKNGNADAFYTLADVAKRKLSTIAETNLLKKACKQGHSNACIKISKRNGVASKDTLVQACESAPRSGCIKLGIHLASKKDYKNARKAYHRACQAGDNESCYMMGRLYSRQGQFEKAKKQHMHSCNSKNAIKSCLEAGKMANKGTKVDPAEVKFYFKKACDGGNQEGCSRLK